MYIRESNLLTPVECKMLIDIHSVYYERWGRIHRDTHLIQPFGEFRTWLRDNNMYENDFIRLIEAKINHHIQNIDKLSFAAYWQIVKWPTGSKQDWHYDFPKSDSGYVQDYNENRYTSVIYLNDDYEGGVTEGRQWDNSGNIVENWQTKKEIGSAITFKGCVDEHRVHEVVGGPRWTILVHYTHFVFE